MTEPLDGRCARCEENTVLERQPCEECLGTGLMRSAKALQGGAFTMRGEWPYCEDCDGQGYFDLTPCCGTGLLDPSDAVEASYERSRETQ